MFRKPYKPAPYFGMPGSPFNPVTGERAPLMPPGGKGTTLALFQVVAEDTHDNYVECRGYEADNDPEFRYLHDPYTVPATTPINVAKPYSLRGTYPYELGQVIVAARIKGRLGFNPGKGTTVGQPADLDEEISLLLDDDDVGIAWLDIAMPSTPEQAMFWIADPSSGISSAEADPPVLVFSSGAITGITLGAGNNPSGYEKRFVATKAQRIYFDLSSYLHKATAAAGIASVIFYVKRWNSLNVLQETNSAVCDIPGGAAVTSGMTLILKGRTTMAVGDYVTVTCGFGGAYANTLTAENLGFYIRPIQNV